MVCYRWVGIFTLVVMFAAPAFAQRPGMPNPRTDPDSQTSADPELQSRIRLEQQKKHFEQMKRDSQKLLELATELKKYVDLAGEHVLSVEVLRKAEEMEKLAHRVKENMRGN